jgi:hypothetical protein
VRLRETPGTAGKFLGWLEDTVQFTAYGRTADSTWIQVTLKNDKRNRSGWLFTDLTALRQTDITALPVTGTAVEASPTPTYAIGAAQVIGGVTGHAREIFLKGQALGNRPNVFSRVGDSITATSYFLTPIGLGQYNLGSYQNQLADVVSFYLGSNARDGNNAFLNQSLAAGNGWGADRILQSGYSHPDICGSDSPLVCEYRIVKPAVALIMIGTNDSGGVEPAVFQANLSQIVQISIDMGVIPILSTIPPKQNDDWNAQRATQWNGIIKQVAQQYDVPLMDYWFALQTAPNHGLDTDGIHPSVPPDKATTAFTPENLKYGYTIRNLTALQALDAIWRLVIY